jgi:hypothetical protein
MTAFAFSRERLRIPGRFGLGGWALGTGDRGGQDKSRKVRTVGSVRNSAKLRLVAQIVTLATWTFRQRVIGALLLTPCGGIDERE